jgi:probable rRNA maturation factor
MLVDEQTIAELNEKWMGHEGVTDVLAWPMDELRPGHVNDEPEEGVLGDLALCPAVAQRQAEEARQKGQAGYTLTDEADLLTVHGILHLLGYDHAEPEEHREMFGLQNRLLAEWQGVLSGAPVE